MGVCAVPEPGPVLDGMVSVCPLGWVDTRAWTGGTVLCGVEVSWGRAGAPGPVSCQAGGWGL